MRRTLATLLAIVTIAVGTARAEDEPKSREPRLDLWREILAARVNERGEVAYRTLASVDDERLETFIRSLAVVDWSRLEGAAAAALWINAYNAGVVWGVLHGGRPDTIRARARLYSWLDLDVGGEHRSIDGIQGELARFAAADPRIHLALCNGARGAPALAREPYEADSLDEQLERAVKRFVDDPERNRLATKRPLFSPLFSWHRTDFSREAGSIALWVAKHLDERVEWEDADASPAFLEFDWRLNAAPGEDPATDGPSAAAKR